MTTLGAALFIAGNLPAHASTIGINFTAGTKLLGASDQPGIVPGANWNNETGSQGTNLALQDSLGGATTAKLTFNSTSVSDAHSGTSTSNAATNLMYKGGLGGDPQTREVTITVIGLALGVYDVYVYSTDDSYLTNTVSISDGTTSFFHASGGSYDSAATSLLLTTSTNAASPTTGPGQYQHFVESGTSFTLTTAGSINNVVGNTVFGLQIVSSPEPSTFLMIFGSGMMLWAIGRVRRSRSLARQSL